MSGDLTALADRARFLHGFRALAVAIVLAWPTIAAGRAVAPGRGPLVACAAYLLVLASAGLGLRVAPSAWRVAFSGLLLVDGIYLVAATVLTGGASSPLVVLLPLHLVLAALLGSYRAAAKLALWHSLLLYVATEAARAELITVGTPALPEDGFVRLILIVAVLWAAAIATATASAVSERELRRRRADLELLAELATDLERVQGSLAVAEVLVAQVTGALRVGRVALVVGGPPSAGTAELTVLAGGAARDRHPRIVGGTLAEVVASRRTALVGMARARRDASLCEVLPRPGNLVLVPLSAEGVGLGVLVVEHDQRQGSRIERQVVAVLERVAAHGGLALRNAWLLEEVQRRAATDGLTGLTNRRTFDDRLARELSRAGRTGEPLSLALLDLDHFKRLNDTHGHQVGDDVLRAFARLLGSRCRHFDTAARFGGEEFALILPRCTPDEAVTIVDRLRKAMIDDDLPVPVTVSAGVSSWPVHGHSAEQLIAAADRALYASKASGRDQVSLAEAELAAA